MNKVEITGRIARPVDVRYGETSGKMVVKFTLAVRRRFKQDGEPDADFISCIAFGKTAEFIEKYGEKGVKLEVAGRIQTGSYSKKDGTKVYTTDILAEEVEFAESKASAGDAEPTQKRAKPEVTDSGDGFMDIPDDADDGGLPFA